MDAGDLQEHSALAPTNPYAMSKQGAENVINAYVKSFKLPVVIIRLNNVYGPHQVSREYVDGFERMLMISSTQRVS